MEKRKLEELNLLDDFLFGAMVNHPEVGERFVKELLKIIFGREFGRLKVIPQKVYLGKDTDRHGTRLDVYLEEEEMPVSDGSDREEISARCSNIYDIEPDKKDTKKYVAVLPKRVRFYHGIIDAQILRSGEGYESLKNVTIIMIVPYDPFGYDRMVYTIGRSCRGEPDMPFEDGSRTMYLYTRGKRGNPPRELISLLHYMEKTTRENAVDEKLQKIQEMVETIKKDEEVSIAYMKSFERDEMIREEVREEEKANTERERKRADAAEAKVREMEMQLKQLQEELARIKRKEI